MHNCRHWSPDLRIGKFFFSVFAIKFSCFAYLFAGCSGKSSSSSSLGRLTPRGASPSSSSSSSSTSSSSSSSPGTKSSSSSSSSSCCWKEKHETTKTHKSATKKEQLRKQVIKCWKQECVLSYISKEKLLTTCSETPMIRSGSAMNRSGS